MTGGREGEKQTKMIWEKRRGVGRVRWGWVGGPLGVTFKPVYAKSESSRVGESLLLALMCPSFIKPVIKILGKIRRKTRFLFVGDYTGVACGHQCQLMGQFSGSQGWEASQADHRQPAGPPQRGRGDAAGHGGLSGSLKRGHLRNLPLVACQYFFLILFSINIHITITIKD